MRHGSTQLGALAIPPELRELRAVPRAGSFQSQCASTKQRRQSRSVALMTGSADAHRTPSSSAETTPECGGKRSRTSRAPHVTEVLAQLARSRIEYLETAFTYRVLLWTRDPELTPAEPRLSSREIAVGQLMTAGLSSKEAGAILSIAAPTVRGALRALVHKLALPAPRQLPLFWHTIEEGFRSLDSARGREVKRFELNLISLLPAEFAGVERPLTIGLLLGSSNAQIAARRGVSPRTVINQVHALFRKVGAASRGEFAALILARSRRSGVIEGSRCPNPPSSGVGIPSPSSSLSK